MSSTFAKKSCLLYQIPITITRSSSTRSPGTLAGCCFTCITNLVRAHARHLVVHSSLTTTAVYHVSDVGNRQRGFCDIGGYNAQTASFWRRLEHLKLHIEELITLFAIFLRIAHLLWLVYDRVIENKAAAPTMAERLPIL